MENNQKLKSKIKEIIIDEQELNEITDPMEEIFFEYRQCCDNCINSLKRLEVNENVRETIKRILEEREEEERFINSYIR